MFVDYLKSFGMCAAVFAMMFAFVSESASLGTRFWLVHWSEQTNVTSSQRDFLIGIYAAIGSTQVLFIFLFNVFVGVGCVSASKFIHESLVKVVLRCPMSFFESTPLGRIINRFSKDMDLIDEAIPRNVEEMLRFILQLVATIVAISYSTPVILAPFVPIALLYVFIQVRMN